MKDDSIKNLRTAARVVLLIYACFWFIFALFSGSEQMGGGMMGVIKNSPNALPWLLLFGLVWLTWKKELIGGILIALMGIFTVFFFKTLQDPIVFLIVSLSLILLGATFIFCQKYNQKNDA